MSGDPCMQVIMKLSSTISANIHKNLVRSRVFERGIRENGIKKKNQNIVRFEKPRRNSKITYIQYFVHTNLLTLI
jgi:hypothetical protein